MSTRALVVESPATHGWDFGDFPYALEPLTLPGPGTLRQAGDVNSCETFGSTCKSLHGLASGAIDPVRPDESVESSDRLFWFRWITGHQVTFAVWQLMGLELEARGKPGRQERLARLVELMNGYSAMLLYTSSTPKRVYHDLIRPSMHLQHRGFSGTWAPDFAPLKSLLRGRHELFAEDGTTALRDAVRTYERVHAGIAARLVPSGRSLLQHSAETTEVVHPDVQGVIYDSYFMTLRASTDVQDVVAQLLRRLNAVARDVAANGLYPVSDEDLDPGAAEAGGERCPPELAGADVTRCEDDLLGIVARVAARAVDVLRASAGETVP